MAVVGWSMCSSRLGRRAKRCISYALILSAWAATLAFLFVDIIESWVTTIGMDAAVEPHPDGISPRSATPTRPEEFLLMPSPLVCQRAKPYLIHMVTSAPANQRARQAIRDTWGGEMGPRGMRIMTFFMVGVPSQPVLGKVLIQESMEKGDLIQGRFLDTYSNLTLKTLSMLSWTRRFCPQVDFLVKVDDDVLFNPNALLRILNKSHNPHDPGDLYLGRVHLHVAPNRDPGSRHYVSTRAYSLPVFPDYCSGTTYVLSRSALLKISMAATASPLSSPLPPEDVFVGVCARAAGVLPSHSPYFSGGPGVPYGRCCYQAMVSIHHISPKEMLRYWNEVHSSLCSWLIQRASLGMCKVKALLSSAVG